LGWLAKRSEVFTNRAGWAVDPLPALMEATPGSLAKFQRVVDGVVHFRITPLDSLGRPLNLLPPGFFYTNVVGLARPGDPRLGYAFRSNAVPAFLDVELGFLEPQAADRWRALPTPAARFRFLTNQQARVHYFQQRVRLHNAPEMLPLRTP
jgi:hypothetical protein